MPCLRQADGLKVSPPHDLEAEDRGLLRMKRSSSRLLNHTRTCPQKAIIISEFEGDPELKEIANRNTMDRCYEKVKNMFKKRK